MKKENLPMYLALAAAVLLFVANFLPGLQFSGKTGEYRTCFSFSVYRVSCIAGILNWIGAAAIATVLFYKKTDKCPCLANKNTKLIVYGGAAFLGILSFVLILLSHSVSVNICGIRAYASVPLKELSQLIDFLPKGAHIGHGVGCWITLAAGILSAAAALVEYITPKKVQ